jgi:hypothetical protein
VIIRKQENKFGHGQKQRANVRLFNDSAANAQTGIDLRLSFRYRTPLSFQLLSVIWGDIARRVVRNDGSLERIVGRTNNPSTKPNKIAGSYRDFSSSNFGFFSRREASL